MSAWLVFRLLKFLSLAALAVGIGLAVTPRRQADRASAAFWVAAPALWSTWVSGYLLLKAAGRAVNEPFVGIAVVASLVGLHGAVLCASRPSPRAVSRWLGLAGLGVATAVMVTRDAPAAVTAVAAAVAAVVAGVLVRAIPPGDGVPLDDLGERARAWFVTVARLEGLSLGLMVLVAMPFRHATGISLDGGTGVLGWGHGVLLLVYLQALQVAARALGWSWGTITLAVLSSLLPLGTFGFEWLRLRSGRLDEPAVDHEVRSGDIGGAA